MHGDRPRHEGDEHLQIALSSPKQSEIISLSFIYSRLYSHMRLFNSIMSTLSPQYTFPFLSLPPELHQKIYGFCTPIGYRWQVSPTTQEPGEPAWLQDRDYNPGTLFRLVQTCRQINNEAAPLLYRCNTFEIDVYIDTQWHQLKISEP